MTIQEKKIIEKHFDSFKSYYKQDLTNLDIHTKIQKATLQSFFKASHAPPNPKHSEEKLATVCLSNNSSSTPCDQDSNNASHLGVCNLVAQTQLKSWYPVVDRKELVQFLIHKMLSDTYNNVLILGASQSGKKNLVYGLAQRIARSEVPLKLKNAKILDICMALERSGGTSTAPADLMEDSNIIYFISNLDRLEELRQLMPQISNLVITKLIFYNNPIIVCNKQLDLSKLSALLKKRIIIFNITDPDEQQAIEIMKINAENVEKIHNCTFPKTIIQQIYDQVTNTSWFYPNCAKIERLLMFIDFVGCVVEARSDTLTPIPQVTIDDIKTVLKEHAPSEKEIRYPSYIS